MSSYALTYMLIHRRRSRAFFSARTAQHVKSLSTVGELVRAAVALGSVVAWGGLFYLLAG